MSTDLRRPISPSGGLAPPVLGYASTRCAPSGPRRQTTSWGTWTPNTSPPFGITHLAQLQVGDQAVEAALAAEAGLPVAAEWRGRVEPVVRVGPDHPGPHPLGHPQDA